VSRSPVGLDDEHRVSGRQMKAVGHLLRQVAERPPARRIVVCFTIVDLPGRSLLQDRAAQVCYRVLWRPTPA
jgi:hypothetical protein